MVLDRMGCRPEVASLAEAIGHACDGPAAKIPVTVKEILCQYTNLDDLLSPEHRTASPKGYMRHVLHGDEKGRFSIVALVWSPGHATPAHAHYTWCAYRIAAGQLQEERYAWNPKSQQATVFQTVQRVCGDTGNGHAGYDQIHRLSNKGRQIATSIHVYGIDAERVSTHVNRLIAGG